MKEKSRKSMDFYERDLGMTKQGKQISRNLLKISQNRSIIKIILKKDKTYANFNRQQKRCGPET